MMVPNFVVAVSLLAALPEPGKGPLALRIDGLGSVRLTVAVPLPGPLPAGDQSKVLSGLSNAEREKLRTRIQALVHAELEAAGFEVVGPVTDGVPLFVVFAEARLDKSDRDPILVQTSVSINEPAVWVRDPTKKGYIEVWKRASTARVSRKDVASIVERQVLEGVKEFTSAQSQGASGKE